MPSRLALACALLAVCPASGNAATPSPLPGGGYSYLVTPAGHMYRVLGFGPMMGGEGKKLATMVTYAGETREVARIATDAEEIVEALGPELELGGETAFIVQANVGYDPRKSVSRSVTYNVLFELRDGRWARLPSKADDPKELGGIDGSPGPPDDPSFPFEPARTKGAADAAAKWVALLDAGEVDASVAAMAAAFRSHVSPDGWRDLLAQRSKVGRDGRRLELYRLQTRSGNVPLTEGGAAVVQYEVRSPQGGRFVERVVLLSEKSGWRPVGYGFWPAAAR